MTDERQVVIRPRIHTESSRDSLGWELFFAAEGFVRENPDLKPEELVGKMGDFEESLLPALNDQISRHFRDIETGLPTGEPYDPYLVTLWTKTGELLREAYGLEAGQQ